MLIFCVDQIEFVMAESRNVNGWKTDSTQLRCVISLTCPCLCLCITYALRKFIVYGTYWTIILHFNWVLTPHSSCFVWFYWPSSLIFQLIKPVSFEYRNTQYAYIKIQSYSQFMCIFFVVKRTETSHHSIHLCAVDILNLLCKLPSVVWMSCFVLERSKCKLVQLTFICLLFFFALRFKFHSKFQTFAINIATNSEREKSRENIWINETKKTKHRWKYGKMHIKHAFRFVCNEKSNAYNSSYKICEKTTYSDSVTAERSVFYIIWCLQCLQ